MRRCENAQRYQRSKDPPCALPDELQADQDQENVDGRVEAFVRDTADQQQALSLRQSAPSPLRQRAADSGCNSCVDRRGKGSTSWPDPPAPNLFEIPPD